ncbi:MAG: N,N-dimethylformamidase beta subunit family domain-containing protein [bacterium]
MTATNRHHGSHIGTLLAAATLNLLIASGTALAQNEISLENALPGNPATEWDVSGAGDASIQGFATDMSVDQGGTVVFKIDTGATDYRIDIYRIGYYGGLGARKVATVDPTVPLPQTPPAPLTDPATGLVDCGNWLPSAVWAVPTNAVSGVYIAKLVREDPDDGRASHVMFVVRDDDGESDLVFQTNDATWQAYNTYGGNSLYLGSPAGRAYKVSYNRPLTSRCCNFPNGSIVSGFFGAQYPMVRWLEANGYDVSYTTCVDTDRFGAEILEHDVFVSVGHDEYWSAAQRANVEAARDAGVHLAFFSGNEVFWKTRWEPSIDGSSTPHRTLVCYKETHANAKIDPLPNVWTGTWRDPRFSPPADGGRPENALLGTIFTVNGIRNDALEVPEADGKMRLWRNTSVATLLPGQVATFAAGTLGFEWDEDLDNGFRPPGLVRLSTTTVSGVPLLQDYGSTYASGTATHHVLMHRRTSGAYVFSAGTVQWSWGLDAAHDNAGPGADPRIQQATVNVFADLGVQPATLQPGLVPATASTDATAPVSSIASPTAGGSVQSGVPTIVSGSASDVGGRVGGIEVSVDNGATWHPAVGRESWTYAWTPGAPGIATIRSRSVDDTANLESPGAGVTVTIEPPGAATCPCRIFTAAPGGPAANDPASVEVGVRFFADRDGLISGVRFYKPGPATGGVHVGSLWTNTGTLLRSATFANETASGWQEVSFGAGNEVPIEEGTLYVASVLMPQGNYAATNGYFASQGVDNPPLHAPPNGSGGFANGVYVYGSGGFPVNSFQSTNYWVDVVFDTLAGPPVLQCALDETSADFAFGSFGVGTYLGETDDGEVMLAPAAGAEFFGGALPGGWSSAPWSGGGTSQVFGGSLAADGARVTTDAGFGPGRSLEFAANFSGAPFQHAGLTFDADVNAPWAFFSTWNGGALYARTSDGTSTLIPGAWLGASHRYRIDWQASGFNFSIDGTPVASIPFAVASNLRLFASDFSPGGGSLVVNWMRISPYAVSGSFTSRVGDAEGIATWGAFTWNADVPSGTSLAMFVRTGDTAIPDGSWSGFAPIANGGDVAANSRYIQYRADLEASDPTKTPTLKNAAIDCEFIVSVIGADEPAGRSLAPVVMPNPVSSHAAFEFAVGAEDVAGGLAAVELTIYDAGGRVVRSLARSALQAGRYRVDWDVRDDHGRPLTTAVYFYRIRAGSTERTGRFVVVR